MKLFTSFGRRRDAGPPPTTAQVFGPWIKALRLAWEGREVAVTGALSVLENIRAGSMPTEQEWRDLVRALEVDRATCARTRQMLDVVARTGDLTKLESR